jgi:hypothetical protein
VLGGGPGAPNRFSVKRGNEDIVPGAIPGKIANYPLKKNDVVISESSGGGGFGASLDRDVNAIEADLMHGYITQPHAEQAYGAVFAGGKIDRKATVNNRDALKAKRINSKVAAADTLKAPLGLRVCGLGAADAKAIEVSTGDIVELIKGDGAPLRCWVRVLPGVAANTVQLSPDSIGLAGIANGDNVHLRPLKTPAGIAATVWRERLEALS